MDEFFSDFQVDPDQLIHKVDIYRVDSTIADEGGGSAIGTDLAPHHLILRNVPCLVGDLSASDIEMWKRLEVTSSHEVYFGSTVPALEREDILMWGSRILRVKSSVDQLAQGIVGKVLVLEHRQ